MIDFNKHFINFSKSKINPGEVNAENQLELLDKLYKEWQGTAFEWEGKGSLTPAEFVETLTATELVRSLSLSVSEIIMDRLFRLPEAAPHLIELLKTARENETKAACILILGKLEVQEPLEIYLNIAQKTTHEVLKESAIDRLKANADAARSLVLNAAKKDKNFRVIAGEILSEGERCDETFNFLTDLFLSGENVPMYAGFLGKYGDERAAAYLYPALDKADFVDYTEIKNAIERLGGLVDESLRDFTSDPIYNLIKGGEKHK